MNIASVEKMDIQPINQPSNNEYSYKAGNPIVSFEISTQNKLLKPSTLRVNGQIRFVSNDGTTLPNNGIVLSRGGGGAPAANAISMNSRVAINSVIQNLVIASNSNNQTLESVRQYGRMCATILGTTHSAEDFVSDLGISSLGTSMQRSTNNNINNEVDFSIRLYSGMINGGENIPLGVNGVRGLNIVLELASDSMVMSGANAGNGSYVLSNLTLTADLLVPDAEGQQQMAIAGNGAFQYNSFNSLYSVINSSDATQTYNLAQNNVLSVFHNFLPTPNQNNYGVDSFETSAILGGTAGNYDAQAVLNRVSFSRGGLRLALDYEIDVSAQSQIGRPETGVLINGINAVKHFSSVRHSLNQKQLIGYGGRDNIIYQAGEPRQNATVAADLGVRNFVVGVGLDNISDVGMSFAGQSYASRIQTNLGGQNPNAVFTYVKSKNILQYSPNGIAVLS